MKFVALSSIRDYAFGEEVKQHGGVTVTRRYWCLGLHALGDDGQLYGYCVDFTKEHPHEERCWVPLTAEVRPAL